MFGIEKILADVLWEMTFYGISDEDIATGNSQLLKEEYLDKDEDDDGWDIIERKQQENDNE